MTYFNYTFNYHNTKLHVTFCSKNCDNNNWQDNSFSHERFIFSKKGILVTKILTTYSKNKLISLKYLVLLNCDLNNFANFHRELLCLNCDFHRTSIEQVSYCDNYYGKIQSRDHKICINSFPQNTISVGFQNFIVVEILNQFSLIWHKHSPLQ